MGRRQLNAQQVTRPKRRATNAHVLRYLQTRDPSKLEENDLKRALEASLEEYPDFWPEESASCSSSEHSNFTSSSLDGASSGLTTSSSTVGKSSTSGNQSISKRRSSSDSRSTHLNRYHHNYTYRPNSNSNHSHQAIHNRYKPVAKKNTYHEADFFHDGIMEYIQYELIRIKEKRLNETEQQQHQQQQHAQQE